MTIPKKLQGIVATQFDLDMLSEKVQKLADRPDASSHIDAMWKRTESIEYEVACIGEQLRRLEEKVDSLDRDFARFKEAMTLRMDRMEKRMDGMASRMDVFEIYLLHIMEHLKIPPPTLA
jgi:predicted nuclease with TOPRIM domain